MQLCSQAPQGASRQQRTNPGWSQSQAFLPTQSTSPPRRVQAVLLTMDRLFRSTMTMRRAAYRVVILRTVDHYTSFWVTL